MARSLKFCIEEIEGLYYLCSENKGTDQLRGHSPADLHICFHIHEKQVFSLRSSLTSHKVLSHRQTVFHRYHRYHSTTENTCM